MNTIGERIKYLRILNKLSMEEFAEKIGANKSGISFYESNKYEPSAKNLVLLSQQFNVSTDWILTGKGKGPDEAAIDCLDYKTQQEPEGFEQTLNFLSNIINEGKISREDLIKMLFELQYEIQQEDDNPIYQEFVSQYEFDLLQNYRLLSERDQGKVEQFIDSLLPKGKIHEDKKKGQPSSSSETTRNETAARNESEGRGIA